MTPEEQQPNNTDSLAQASREDLEEKPRDLPPQELEAWDLLSGGMSYAKVGEAVNRSAGTVSAWVRKWKAELGVETLFHGPQIEKARESTEVARAVAETVWQDERSSTAIRFGLTGRQVAATARDLLSRIGDGIITGRDVKDLALAAAIFTDKAELLVGNPTAHTRRSVPQDQFIVPPAPESARTPEQNIGMVIDMVDRIKNRTELTG